MTRIETWSNGVLVAAFAAVIVLPPALLMLGPEPVTTLQEKRVPSPPPDPATDPVETWPGKMTAYFNDHYGLRDTLVHWHGWLKHVVFGARSDRVIVGQDGWLYLNRSDTLGDHRRSRNFTNGELERYARVLQDRGDWLRARGIEYQWVVVPNKEDVYPEHLPDALKRDQEPSRLDQLMAHLRAHTDVSVVDLRAPLKSAGGPHLLYHRNDSHWNHRGVLAAYRHLCERLRERFPDLVPLGPDDLRFHREPHPGDLAALLGIPEAFPDDYDVATVVRRVPREVPPGPLPALTDHDTWGRTPAVHAFEGPPQAPRLLVFRDSFVTPLFRECLAAHFARSLFVLATPSLESLRSLVDHERPQVVLEVVIERYLGLVPADFWRPGGG